MNNNLFWILALLPFQLAAQTTISGTLKNYNRNFIVFGKVSDYELLSDMDTIFLNDGAFEKKLQLEQLAAVNIDFFFSSGDVKWQRIVIFASPGDRVHFDIDFRKDSSIPSCKFSGSNAAGHDLFYQYNARPLISHSVHFSNLIHSQTDAAAAYKLFTANMDTFIAPYKSLLYEQKIVPAYFKVSTDFIKTGISSAVLYSLFSEPDAASLFQHKSKKEALGQALLDYSPSFEEVSLLAGSQFSYLITNFQYRQLIQNNCAEPSDTIVYLDNQKYVIDKNFKGFLDLQDHALKEFYFAHRLHFYYQTMLGEAFVRYYDTQFLFFKKTFPESKYTSIFELDRIKNSQRLSAFMNPGRQPDIALIANRYFELWSPVLVDEFGATEGLGFKNPQKDFSAGTYYIDIWATWCKSCISKMKHNCHADSLLYANGIERIYISIDALSDRDQWLSTIYELQLGGYHILAGEKLKSSLYQKFGNGSNSMAVPRYLFMKGGEVINAFAAYPDELERLEEQVRAISQ